jgi:hypothetical protein
MLFQIHQTTIKRRPAAYVRQSLGNQSVDALTPAAGRHTNNAGRNRCLDAGFQGALTPLVEDANGVTAAYAA